jgi:hypothetical protein
MPAVLTSRPPLHPLDMASMQRPKRKTATRMAFDEDEPSLPAKKKSKIGSEEPVQANGKANKKSKGL